MQWDSNHEHLFSGATTQPIVSQTLSKQWFSSEYFGYLQLQYKGLWNDGTMERWNDSVRIILWQTQLMQWMEVIY